MAAGGVGLRLGSRLSQAAGPASCSSARVRFSRSTRLVYRFTVADGRRCFSPAVVSAMAMSAEELRGGDDGDGGGGVGGGHSAHGRRRRAVAWQVCTRTWAGPGVRYVALARMHARTYTHVLVHGTAHSHTHTHAYCGSKKKGSLLQWAVRGMRDVCGSAGRWGDVTFCWFSANEPGVRAGAGAKLRRTDSVRSELA